MRRPARYRVHVGRHVAVHRVMCEHGDTVPVRVHSPGWLTHSGEAEWRTVPVDRCIAPIVELLVASGVYTSGACCGHGNGPGEILLQDGRAVEVREGDRPDTVDLEVRPAEFYGTERSDL